MFLPMNKKDLFRFIRACFWDAMEDFVSMAYRPPGMDKLKTDTYFGFSAVLEDEECKKEFLAETKEGGLKIIWLVRCYDCEEDNDVEVILSYDNPGKPIACPKCGEKRIDVILKGVMEA